MSADGSFGWTGSLSLTRPDSGEAPFGLDEMFFSRTDTRGVIASFNGVFVRVADYDPAALLNAPHRIIRHPDMPKGIFWLMWQGLQRGNLMGTYVKNRARDGLHYWVFAMIQPVEGGYLSIRIKPSSAQLAVIEREYATLLQRERDECLTPEQSGKAMLARLKELGWRNYAAFQTDSICAELQSRSEKLGRGKDMHLDDLAQLLAHSRQLRAEVRDLQDRFAGANLLTINMQIIATKLREGRLTISEIAKNYGLMVTDIRSHLRVFNRIAQESDPFEASPEAGALFQMCAARMVREACNSFQGEVSDLPGVHRDTELAMMQDRAAWAEAQADRALADIVKAAAEMHRSVGHLRRLIVGLSIVRIACRVESGVLAQRSQGLETIVARLDGLQEEIGTVLDRIDAAGVAGLECLARYDQRGDAR